MTLSRRNNEVIHYFDPSPIVGAVVKLGLCSRKDWANDWPSLIPCVIVKSRKFIYFIIHLQPIPGGARIDVSINELYDGSYTGSPHDLIAGAGRGTRATSGPRAGPTRRTCLTHVLVCRPRPRRRPHRHSLAEFLELDDSEVVEAQRPYLTGHNRWVGFGNCRPLAALSTAL